MLRFADQALPGVPPIHNRIYISHYKDCDGDDGDPPGSSSFMQFKAKAEILS
jgi:hypothetical protein